MVADISTIVQQLAKRRADLRMTQRSVANLAGITQSYLSAIEKGKIDTRLSTLQDIARALNTELVPVPTEKLDAVQSLIGHGPPPNERRLFSVESD